MNSELATRWTRFSVTLGAVVWVVLVVLARMEQAPLGVIELLFLFAPLVIVPLGLELGRLVGPPETIRWLDDAVRKVQPLAAAIAVTSFWCTPGWKAGALVAPWLLMSSLVALWGVVSLLRDRNRSLATVAVNVGRVDLAVAAGWLLLSRSGLRPLGVQEPIVLLTAVHFHYTGFATSLLAGTLVDSLQQRGKESSMVRFLVLLVVFVPFAVAAGFVFSPVLKVFAAVILSASVAGLAMAQFWFSKGLQTSTARGFLRISAAAVIVGMALAATYAVGEILGKEWLLIPRMASTHGLLNGIGFVLLGLLGWLVEWHSDRQDTSLV